MNELTPQEQEALRGLYPSRGFNKTTHDSFGAYIEELRLRVATINTIFRPTFPLAECLYNGIS